MMTIPVEPLHSARLDVMIFGNCVRMTLGHGRTIDISDEDAMELARRLEEAAIKLFISKIEAYDPSPGELQ